ncbi:MAG: S41 family peptidase, partial [Agathobacter sp.]|nr:S41 family peptidase [Agathobacter sp.]
DYYEGVSTKSFVVERDDINKLEYIQVNSFDNKDGRELQRYLANTTYDKIVIDLRDNYGGVISYAKDYIFPELYSEDARMQFDWKVPNTDSNKKMTDRPGVNLLYFEDKDEDYYYYSESLSFDGRATEDKEVYYLVGPGTGSAADKYIAMIKENGLGTIVGMNTGGEGRGASYICDRLKESSLVYVYYPSESINEDAICGTAPDVYVNQRAEDYALYEKMRIEGTASLYESRVQYDTVLKWVIEQ